MSVEQSPDDELAETKDTKQDADVSDTGKVTIIYIDERVPIDVVKRLFEIAGRVRSYKVLDDSNEVFHGTVKLEYEHSKDAAAAAKLLNNNISFYGLIWHVMCDYSDKDDGGDVNVVDADDDEDDDEGDDGGDNDEDDDKGDGESDSDDDDSKTYDADADVEDA